MKLLTPILVPNIRQVARSLNDLLKIKGGQDVVVRLLSKFRQEYIKRPAMIDELSKVI